MIETQTNDLDIISGVLCRAVQLSEGEHYRIAVEATNALDRIRARLVTPQTKPCCQKCGKPGSFALSGLCNDCEIEEIQEELMDGWIEPMDIGAQ